MGRQEMEDKRRFTLIHYFKMHRKSVFVWISFVLILSVIFALYRLPVEAVFYGAALCLFCGLTVMGADYLHVSRNYRQLMLLQKEIRISLDKLPDADNDVERIYQELLLELFEEMRHGREESYQRYQELTEYYAIWAHQIKTPIAAIKLLRQEMENLIYEGQEKEPEGEDQAGSASLRQRELFLMQGEREELARIEQYVQMALAVLRLDSDSTDYVIREYELNDIVKQALRKFAGSFIYKKLQLKYEPFQYSVITDEKWFQFVLEQVLSNALKYTKSGFVEITLEEPGILCVRDSGMGIAPEDLPRVFEKGYTGYNGRSDKKASGIGLYLCRRICRKLGHTITLDSAPGQGTLVRIGVMREKREMN